MIVLKHRPGPPLDQFVELLWYSAGYSPAHGRERVLPTGITGLVFNLLSDRIRIAEDNNTVREYSGAVVSGARSQPLVLESSEQKWVVGVQFRACGAWPVLGLPASDLTNSHIALEDIWGRRAYTLRQRLLEAKSPMSVLRILEYGLNEHLLELPRGFTMADRSVEQFASASMSSVHDVGKESGYSHKRFIHLFNEIVGLTPKTFCRVQRFQTLLDRINPRSDRRGWAGIAYDLGYFDQSHLIRDFREFAGVTPGQYRPVSPDRKNHLSLASVPG